MKILFFANAFQISESLFNSPDLVDQAAFNGGVTVKNRTDVVNQSIGAIDQLPEIFFLYV